MSIITTAQLKTWLGISDAIDDAPITTAVAAANAAVVDHCRRTFDKVNVGSETARVFYVASPFIAYIDDVWDTTNLAVKTDENDDGTFDLTWAATDYQLEPLNGRDGATAVPYWRVRAVNRCFPTWGRRPALQVTAAWGWSAVPDAVTQATLIKASRVFRRKDSPEGVLGGFADLGPVRISRSEDPDVVALLRPYVKVTSAGG